MASDHFGDLVNTLRANPTEQCVVREEFLNGLGVDPYLLAAASARKVRRVKEIVSVKDNVGVQDTVYVFAPEETA
ncbi:MAG TPA: hypothetical protein PLL33_02040 [Paracoccus sp. (in: a-proteobacteria)]|nr:hypothetical protein [Paracoccus sp. (in: a-proteobacteria)]